MRGVRLRRLKIEAKKRQLCVVACSPLALEDSTRALDYSSVYTSEHEFTTVVRNRFDGNMTLVCPETCLELPEHL